MSKAVKVVHLLDRDGGIEFISSVPYSSYTTLVSAFKRGHFNSLLCREDRTYRVTFTDGSTELWRNSPGDPAYVYRKVGETTVSSEGMSYKDALEYMTTTTKPTYNKEGVEYRVCGCRLWIDGSIQERPCAAACFTGLRLFTSKPKPAPVYIPFWDAVKAAGQDGKCISKFENKGKGISATYRYRPEYPTGWEYWNGGSNRWGSALAFLNHSTDPDNTTYWAIVDDPSKES